MDSLVVLPSPSTDFDTVPLSPSTPARFGDYRYFSAPASPTRVSQFYRDFDEFITSAGDSSSVAYEDGDDFAFDYRAEREEELLSAEELFDGGVIRPLKLPPGLRPPRMLESDSLSPETRKESRDRCEEGAEIERGRGRERVVSSSPSRKTARSHSPLRVSAYPWEEDHGKLDTAAAEQKSTPSSSSKKWSIRDLLLFRSATDKNHPFRKYSGIFQRRGPRVSAHELHYTANKAVSEGLKKKTFLPSKQGILGRLSMSFNPTVHSITNGFGSLWQHQR